jgi:threonine dehydratase
MTCTVSLSEIYEARDALESVARKTPLTYHEVLSERLGATVYLKREDLQVVRSYKIRGAYNRMRQISANERSRGVVCASAGNHAQGVAFGCKSLGIHGTIFMPTNTPSAPLRRLYGDNPSCRRYLR